jgi:hypothetical protein
MPGPQAGEENLFSEDPRRQYAALKELEAAAAITKAQYDRIHEIRWATRHLALAELAEKILREKRFLGPMSMDARQEILELLRQCERQQRARILKALEENPAIALRRTVLARWLIAAALGGFLLGGGLAYRFAPSGAPRDSPPAEAYIDTRTGKLISADSLPDKHAAAGGKDGNYQPAFYCWKCRQWLPIKKPQKHDSSLSGPLQAISERPVVPPSNRNRPLNR